MANPDEENDTRKRQDLSPFCRLDTFSTARPDTAHAGSNEARRLSGTATNRSQMGHGPIPSQHGAIERQ